LHGNFIVYTILLQSFFLFIGRSAGIVFVGEIAGQARNDVA